MKHPVDTSAWGEFIVGELFKCDTTKTFYPNKSELPEGNTPYITRSTYDNGISGYYNDINNEFTIEGDCLTIGAEGGIAFWQPKPFIAGVKVYTIRHPHLNELTALFIASLLNTNSANYSYTNARVLAKIKAETIKLPLKPSANPSNYTQDDIDWDYMKTVMSRVTARAKERLANLPQPTDKQKTPVDTSAWGEFVVGELFELTGIKQVKSQHHVVEDPDGIPFVVQSNKNNMVKMKADKQWLLDNDEPVVEGNAIVLGVTLPVVSYQPYEFGASQVITARSEHLNELRGLFIASVINSFVIPKYSYVYKPGIQKYKQDVIPLPLKPSANPSNYTQEDIDWDYMEHFMQAIENKAHDRLKTLQKSIA